MSLSNRDKPLVLGGRKRSRCRTAGQGLRRSVAASLGLIGLAVVLHGCGRREIIRPTPQMDVEPQYWVRVLLLANAAECTVEMPSAFRILRPDAPSGTPAGPPLMEAHRGPVKVSFSDSGLLLGATPLAGEEIILSPESPHIFRLNGQAYRGRLKLSPGQGAGGTFDAVNIIPLEPYLAGVVGEEMPDYWEPQALRAQAIAARTYCLYIKNRFGVNRAYDVSRTQSSQVYGGIGAESSQTWEAVNSTYGVVLVTKDARPQAGLNLANRGLFPAYYSSVCGGHTAASDQVFGDSFGPLKGVACPYCQDVAKLGLFFWPMVQFDRQTITRQLVERYPQLGALGGIKKIVPVDRSDYGKFARLTRIKLVGATGRSDTLRAEDLRLAIDPSGRRIKSTICHILPWGDGWAFLSGRGWGHGVGMCQCGAEGMARLGHSAEEILRYYYPECEIVSIY